VSDFLRKLSYANLEIEKINHNFFHDPRQNEHFRCFLNTL